MNVNLSAKDLIMALLSSDPNIRPSAYDALQFEWFSSLMIPIQESLQKNDSTRNFEIPIK